MKPSDAAYVALETPRDALLSHEPPPSTSSSSSSAPPARLVSLAQLFSFADATDRVLMAVGTVASLVAGVSQPLQIVLIGDVMNAFRPKDVPAPAQLRANVNSVALNFVFVGLAVLLLCFLQVACWSLTASRQAKRLRAAYVAAILRQEIAWFDVHEPLQLSTRVADSTVAIQEGMGRKVGDGLHFFSMGVSGIVIGLIKGWQLCLVLLAFAPLLGATAFIFMRKLSEATQSGVQSYAKAGAVAQEALANPRTVHMFNSVPHFVAKYAHALEATTRAGIAKGVAVGAGIGIMYFVLYCTYAASMYYGAVLIAHDQLDGHRCDGAGCYDGGKVMTVFFAAIMGAMALGQAGPSLQAVYSARTAAYDVFDLIHRASQIDPTAAADTGRTLPSVAGTISLENVTFAYPSRPEVDVCRGYSLEIAAGETVALVGPSGSGKSTIVSLLERFYDPQSGRVAIDGVDVRELHVKWLRAQIGLVGQEPALFATSIRENIRHGRPDASDDDVVQAAKMANAYDFITAFSKGFDTEVGERGTQLSGGQKQRIAIARAIIKNPPILLLDEATSALDTESERVVQESLDRLLAEGSRTTIIIAHRLSTIRNADRIAVHKDGKIVEMGTHDELMQIPNGQYKTLVEAQSHVAAIDEEEEEEERRTVDTPAAPKATRQASQRVKSHHSTEKGLEDSALSQSSTPDADDETPVPLSRVWQLTLPDWKFLIVGGLGGIVSSAVFPIWGVILTKIMTLYFELDRSESQMLSTARHWTYGLLGLGVVFCASITAQHYGFAVASQRLVARVRKLTFQAMLSQEIGWFDMEEHSSGALVARLATDSATLHALTADTLNQGLVNVTTLGIGLAIAFFYSWQMTLVNLAILPLFGFTVMIQTKQYAGTLNNRESNSADLAAGSLLSEAIGAIRTVASFSMEASVATSYVGFVDVSKKTDAKAGVVGGLAFGVAQALMFLNLALLFYVGGKFVADGTVAFNDMFMVMLVLLLSLFPIGMAAQNATDSAKAQRAASSVFRILDRTSLIDPTTSDGTPLDDVQGELAFKSVVFAYPSRPDQPVYRDYHLRVQAGQTVALVGASGSGKSTAIALLERFYDPLSGSVTLDGADLRSLPLPWLRERISLVSQEPVLFAGTIAENIAMGKPNATREEIEDAARKANALEFIQNFPNGLDTDVGDRGAQVSGGQKQRIAIARAILRDPAVLLLDEATSALDNESERVVQKSLDELVLQKRRTTIIVAHRLSTIRNADLIAVTKDGAIVEQGTHDELMQIERGVYRALVARQMATADA